MIACYCVFFECLFGKHLSLLCVRGGITGAVTIFHIQIVVKYRSSAHCSFAFCEPSNGTLQVRSGYDMM